VCSIETRANGWSRRHSATLDRAYLDPQVRKLAAALEKPEILAHWEACARGESSS